MQVLKRNIVVKKLYEVLVTVRVPCDQVSRNIQRIDDMRTKVRILNAMVKIWTKKCALAIALFSFFLRFDSHLILIWP